jgi:hypothetical protein
MDEKPKSIWKKSWTGRRGLLLWLIPLTLLFIVVYANGNVPDSLKNYLGLPAYALFFSLFVTLMLSFAVRFVRWVFCWRNFKRFLFGLACFVTLVALFYAEENWRGKHDWGNYKREWQTRGEKFDFKDFVPPPVPDDQNFAMAPIVASSYETMLDKSGHEIIPRNTNVLNRLQMRTVDYGFGSDGPTNNGYWLMAKTSGLEDWQNYYRWLAAKTNDYPVPPHPQTPAQDVLIALSKYNPAIEELREAGKLSYSRFPIEYDKDDPAEILLPHLGALKQTSQVLQLRAIAELQNGQSEAALADIKLIFRLLDSVRSEPFIISQLVRFAIFQIAIQPVYEGLAEHKWTDAQLGALDSELAKLDFLADYEFSIRGEPAAHTKVIDYLEQKRSRYWKFFGLVSYDDNMRSLMNNFWETTIIYLMPKGWFYQNKIVLAQMNQKWNVPMVDDAHQTVSPKMAVEGSAAELNIRPGLFNFFARLLLPSLGSFAQKTAYAQSTVNLARIAIALERYRLAHEGFPESLDALTPQFMEKIPHDVIGGQPLHYRRTDEGSFVLYSVGWNETDDGGVVAFKQKSSADESSADIDISQGDWVWRYPAR